MKKFVVGFLAVTAIALAACGRQEQAAPSEPPASTSLDLSSSVVITPFGAATVTTDGNTISVQRSGEGPQGVTITRVADAATAVALRFDVEGSRVRLRIRQDGRLGYAVKREQNNTVMVGPRGASELTIMSDRAPTITVSVSSVTDCGASSEARCSPAELETAN